ncbi:MAG: 2-oxoglutarate dehydrogenase E1 component [Candidatus Nucleicultricaceae bacterium]
MQDDRFSVPSDNVYYVEQLYLLYLEKPELVDPSWREIFKSVSENQSDIVKDLFGASWNPRQFKEIQDDDAPKKLSSSKGTEASSAINPDHIRLLIGKERLLNAYRRFGHTLSKLDPLHLVEPAGHLELDPSYHGLTDADLDKALPGGTTDSGATLREVIENLKSLYCGTIGAEIEHIRTMDERLWLREQFETKTRELSAEQKKRIYSCLVAAEGFENFLHVKFPSAKRFGLEGGESMMAGLDYLVRTSAENGVKEIVFGMAHRGRLNVIVNIIKHHARRLLAEFQGNHGDAVTQIGSGDVKYHLGVSNDRMVEGHPMHLTLMSNPSHLEFVNPVVAGKVRGRQTKMDDKERKQALGVLIHGDAAFAGQGVVAETLLLANLEGYTVGGTLHFIINNQVGFTASPHMLKSSAYCSDLAKTIDAPIFHVNGDDPEAVIWITNLAASYQRRFGRDAFIDLVCYRKYGHNEMDEPAFTQPVMYQAIRQQPSVKTQYYEKLQSEGVAETTWLDQISADYDAYMNAEMAASATFKFGEPDWFKGAWEGLDYRLDDSEPKTGIAPDQLEKIARAIAEEPQNFSVNSKIQRLINDRADMLLKNRVVDWSVGEALAFGSLLNEGIAVRLSGQDCRRGTFTQRHAVYTDQSTQNIFVPLNTIREGQAFFEVLNSPLSETAVLGFELGYSYADPKSLVIWEAQFGDFANGAQVIVDQFISSGEAKWHRLSGLVMMLPHSYDGQGPEHTSARLERYLQLCAENNMRVANCSTPANLFHILRRQMHSKTRKPLIIMTPKALLRHKRVVSSLDDFLSGTEFQSVIKEVDAKIKPAGVKRVIVCSGKVYYDLLEKREAMGTTDVALIRLEQFYPFPKDALIEALKVYKDAELVWCQEESENMGAWHFVDRRLEEVLRGLSFKFDRPIYIGRKPSASPATGFAEHHQHEQEELVLKALTL